MDKNELDIVKQAILNEIEGYEFYKMAARQSGSRESEEAFNDLANEELLHADYLRELFNKLKDGKEDDFALSFLSDPPSPKIFDWSKIESKASGLALSVFSIGMQMEKESMAFYENTEKSTQNENARKLYKMLAYWESVHLQQFTAQYNRYKEEWWSNQGYAPF